MIGSLASVTWSSPARRAASGGVRFECGQIAQCPVCATGAHALTTTQKCCRIKRRVPLSRSLGTPHREVYVDYAPGSLLELYRGRCPTGNCRILKPTSAEQVYEAPWLGPHLQGSMTSQSMHFRKAGGAASLSYEETNCSLWT